MGSFKIKYTGSEAVEIIKNYYPNNWFEILETKKTHLVKLANRQKLSLEDAYRKFIIPYSQNQESIVFFAALSELIKLRKMPAKEKAQRILELENQRENVAGQIVSLEKLTNISHEDKKILRGYYNRLQQETTAEINQLINSFEVVEPQLIIHQPGLFDSAINS